MVEAALAWGLGLDLYDTTSVAVRTAAILGSAAAAIGAARLTLGMGDLPRSDATVGALWATFVWFPLFASHFTYIGVLLVPLEVGIAAVAIRHRIGVDMKRAVAGAVAARLAAGLVRLGMVLA